MGATVNIKGRWAVRDFTVKMAGGVNWYYRVIIPEHNADRLKHDKYVQALLNYKFDSATDAGVAGQAMFKNATYGVG